jgi:hypothetical protein
LKSEFYEAIDEALIDEIAHKHGFCKRKRKLTPRNFLETILLRAHQGNQESLMDHVYELRQNRNISVRKQSLQNKFSCQAVAFMRELLEHQLKISNRLSDSSILNSFSKVYLQDSTRFGLPDQLKDDYPCFGGSGAQAGAQIQFVYELRRQQVCQMEVYSAKRNDAHLSVNNHWLEKDALVLRDLGYFTSDGFKEIIAKQAYFISKAKPKTTFYTLDNQKIDLKNLLNRIKQHGLQYIEENLIMGFEKQKKVPVRVIFSTVPDSVREQRLRNAQKNARTRNWTVTKEYKLWAGINVFITNIPTEIMTPGDIPMVYRLRWQVELIFKTWKSHYKINLYKAVKKERIECYLYGSLILILLQFQLFSWLQYRFDRQKIWLSIYKFSKVMIHLKTLFRQAFIEGSKRFYNLMRMLISLSEEELIKEEKKGTIGYNSIITHCL